MARVTYVKHARQRYEMVPVLDEEGNVKRAPVTRRSGAAKTTKTGREVTMRLTVADKSKPKPNRKCEKCGGEIKVGDPYKHVTPKSGPYGGHKRVRCGTCPTWKPSELSSARTAPIMAAQEEFDVTDYEEKSEFVDALNDFAEVVREVANELKDGADNMEEGFGHSTSMSEELRDRGETMEQQADDIESFLDGIDDEPPACSEHDTNEEDCDECQSEREGWLDELRNACDDALSSVDM